MSTEIKRTKVDSELWKYIQDNSIMFAKEDLFLYPEQQNCFMPGAYEEVQEKILNFEIFPDDIWIVTFPKSGTTWAQEMVWLIQHDLDYESAKVDVRFRFPFVELPGISTNVGLTPDPYLQNIKDIKRPRLFKSHMPVGLLPRQLWEVKPKIVFVFREPKDVAASWLYHHRMVFDYKGTREKFYEAFISGHLLYGSYWGNVAASWKMRHEPNVLVLSFEDMKKDLPSMVRRTANFLNKPVPEDKLEGLLEHLQFSRMKDNDNVNHKGLMDSLQKYFGSTGERHFFNKGEVGNYKNKMSPEWIRRFDEWKEQEKVKYGLDKEEFLY